MHLVLVITGYIVTHRYTRGRQRSKLLIAPGTGYIPVGHRHTSGQEESRDSSSTHLYLILFLIDLP